MLAIYNGKEYVCRDNSRLRNDGTRTKCWLELRSHTKDEAEQYLKLAESEWGKSNRR